RGAQSACRSVAATAGTSSVDTPLRSALFFFSSRRRHTRSKRDWSSDVCSSDLVDGLLDELQRTIDPQERLDISEQVQRLLLERGYTVPIYDRVQFAGAAAGLSGAHTDLEGKPVLVDAWPG